jgi:hypothetical protein
MEMSQGNSLGSYLKQTETSFCKNEGQEGKNWSCLGAGTSGREEDI